MLCDTKRAWLLLHSYFLKRASVCTVMSEDTLLQALCFDLNLNHWQTFRVVDHTKSCIRAKHFRLSAPNDAMNRESNQWYWHVSQFLTKLDCEQSLSVPQRQSSGRGNTKTDRQSRNWLYIIGEHNSKTSRLITMSLTRYRFTVSDFKLSDTEYIVCMLVWERGASATLMQV